MTNKTIRLNLHWPNPTTPHKGGGAVSRLPLFKAALEAQTAGTRNAMILCIGDSTTAGQGACANEAASSYPRKLSALLPAGRQN
jgi:hypothetical protein